MDSSLPARLHPVAWPDPVIDHLGFAPQGPYSEYCWLPRLGPASTLAFRRLAATISRRPDGFEIDVVEFARSLGLGTGTGAHAPVSRTVRRLAGFELARFVDDSTYAVRRRIPPLSARHLKHLSADLAQLHTEMLARHHAEIDSVRTG